MSVIQTDRCSHHSQPNTTSIQSAPARAEHSDARNYGLTLHFSSDYFVNTNNTLMFFKQYCVFDIWVSSSFSPTFIPSLEDIQSTPQPLISSEV